MNHAYRLVWNAASASYVPAPESARSRSKTGSVKALVAAIALLGGSVVFAADLPTGGNIVAGNGSISGSGTTLNVNQNSNKLITNWQSFDISAGHTVNFIQPGANAIALNRVVGNNASQIFGSLNANGQVFLVNPNGVLFGQGASVNVGGLVASTLNITDNDFLNGNYSFSGKGRNSTNAAVINKGNITADGGVVALLGGTVSNQGVIQANLGSVALAAGNKVALDFAGDGLLKVRVDESALNALVENHQLIKADGGSVLLTAKATDALLQTVVNNTGRIEARTIEEREGKIILLGGFEGGVTQVGGTLDASAPVRGDGGFIETSGANISFSADMQITTRSEAGKGGLWLIDPSEFTIDNGPDTTANSVSASYLSALLATTNVAISTDSLVGGTGDINVNAAVSWSSSYALNLTAVNDININAAINASSGGLTLDAQGDINSAAALVVGGNSSFSAVGDIVLTNAANNFGGGVSLSGRDISLTDSSGVLLSGVNATGTFTVIANGEITQSGSVVVTGVSDVNASGNDITLDGTGNKFGGAISFNGNDVTLTNGIALELGAGVATGKLNVRATGDITQSAALVVDGNSSFSSASNITLSQAGNDFGGTLSVDGNDVHVRSSDALDLSAVTATRLTLQAVGNISSSAAINVSAFLLQGGNWVQNSASLPAFSATDFRIQAGTFLRVSSGDGSAATPYRIADIYGLQGINGFLDKSFELTNDIDASGTVNWSAGAGFDPLGTYNTRFSGIFDGLGYSISGLHIDKTVGSTMQTVAVGLFGATAGGSVIRNVGIDGGDISSGNATASVGSLVGVNGGSISNSYARTSVSGPANTGGLVGINGGDITRSYFSGSVLAGNASVDTAINIPVGGLVGNNAGSISQSYSTGTVNAQPSGFLYAGGLVGYNTGSILQSYSTSAITTRDHAEYVGGLVGRSGGGSISESYAATAINAGNSTVVGGVIGGGANTTLTKNFWDTDISARAAMCGMAAAGCDNSAGLTSTQMKNSASFVGWDIDTQGGGSNVWRIYEGNTAPLLKAFLTTLNVSVSSSTLTYDGQLHGGTASYTAQFPGLVLGSTQTSSYRNAGSYTLDLPDLYSTQRGYDIVTTGGTLIINKANLGINAVTDSKVYDGNSNSAQVVNYSGLVAGDTLTGLSQSFDSKNVLGSNGSTLSVNNGYVLNDGNGGGNYAVTVNTGIGTITAKALMLSAVADSRVYDAGTTSTGVVTVSGLAAGDTVSGLAQSFDSKNTGNRTLSVDSGYSVNDGNNGANYSITEESVQGSITAASLLLAAVTDTKDYDGNTSSGAIFSVTGLLGSDSVDDREQAFTSKHVLGTGGSTLAVSNYTVNDGNGGANYIVTTQDVAGTISPANLQIGISDVSKVYDGTRNVDAGAVTVQILSGTLKGSDTLGSGSYAYTDANAGSGKTITVSGFTVDDGNFGGNYSVSYVNNSTSEITPAALTIKANDQQIIYGGAPYSGGNGLSYTGFVNGETESVLAGVAAYGGNAQGAVEIGDYVIAPSGLSSSNYNITFVDGNLNVSPPIFTVPGAPVAGHEAALTAQHQDTPLPSAPADSFVIDVRADGIRLVAVPTVQPPAATPVANTKPAAVRAPLKEMLPPNGSLLFASNSPLLNEEEARKLLQALAERLKANPDEKVQLIGHTDSTGTERYNESLSAKRAQAVARVLESLGVAPEQIVVTGDGFRNPLDNNRKKEGRARNRRVDFALP
ncbi:MAG: YDG domain-containing protein [Pedobacter sp.]|nr:YDG domain-containing protein [Pedobacter sp.]